MNTAIIYPSSHSAHPTNIACRYLTLLAAGIETLNAPYFIRTMSSTNKVANVKGQTIKFDVILDPDDRDISIEILLDIDTNIAIVVYDYGEPNNMYFPYDDVSPVFQYISTIVKPADTCDITFFKVTKDQEKQLSDLADTF